MNQKIRIALAAVVGIFLVFALGMAVWERMGDSVEVELQNVEQQEIAENQEQQEEKYKEKEITDISTWKTYRNNIYSFEFKYPKDYSIEIHNSDSYSELSIKDASKNLAAIKITAWKDFVIEEGTPGTFWQKIGYANWKYFVDNFNNIKDGDCDNETRIHVMGPTAGSVPEKCFITKQENFIKTETETAVTYNTKNIRILIEGSQENFHLISGIASTLAID